MLRYLNYDIVFQEVPGEVSLAINITNCPNRCKGCHSPELMKDIGEELNESVLLSLLEKYGKAIGCICFMGGDASPKEVQHLATFLKKQTAFKIKVAWYSGRQELPSNFEIVHFDFIKLGPYVQNLGGLNSLTTNQRFYRVENAKMIDDTKMFFKIGHSNFLEKKY